MVSGLENLMFKLKLTLAAETYCSSFDSLSFFQSADQVIGKCLGNLACGLVPLGAEPARRPVERSQDHQRGKLGITRDKLARPDSCRHEAADSALVAVALGQEASAQGRRETVDLKVCHRSFDFVEDAAHVSVNDDPELVCYGLARDSGLPKGCEHLLEGMVLAEVEQLLFAFEVVVEVAGGEARDVGDLPHAGGGEAPCAKRLGGGAQDIQAPGIIAAAHAGLVAL